MPRMPWRPTLGRGACESLVDAVTLADLLNTLPVEQALRAYHRQRRLRTRALSLASSALARVALAEGGQPLRDRLLSWPDGGRRVPPSSVLGEGLGEVVRRDPVPVERYFGVAVRLGLAGGAEVHKDDLLDGEDALAGDHVPDLGAHGQ